MGVIESSNNEESSNGLVVEVGLVFRKVKMMKMMKYLF